MRSAPRLSAGCAERRFHRKYDTSWTARNTSGTDAMSTPSPCAACDQNAPTVSNVKPAYAHSFSVGNPP
jgi:hypothetical protein